MDRRDMLDFLNANKIFHLATVWTMETNFEPKKYIRL